MSLGGETCKEGEGRERLAGVRKEGSESGKKIRERMSLGEETRKARGRQIWTRVRN